MKKESLTSIKSEIIANNIINLTKDYLSSKNLSKDMDERLSKCEALQKAVHSIPKSDFEKVMAQINQFSKTAIRATKTEQEYEKIEESISTIHACKFLNGLTAETRAEILVDNARSFVETSNAYPADQQAKILNNKYESIVDNTLQNFSEEEMNSVLPYVDAISFSAHEAYKSDESESSFFSAIETIKACNIIKCKATELKSQFENNAQISSLQEAILNVEEQ